MRIIFLILFLIIQINECEGKKEWKRPEDGRARLVTGNDGVQTIVFESPTQGTWEIGNGEIWHLPIGGTAKNVTPEFEQIPKEYVVKKKTELKTGSIRNQGDASASIRPFAGNKQSGSIRNPVGTGSIRTAPSSSGSIRTGIGKKQWNRPNDGRARLVKGEDGVQTIVFESPTQGTWEIGNGEIWHLPIGGTAKNVTAEFEPIPKEYIEKKKTELKGGSIRNQGDAAGSIRPFAGNKPSGGGGSIRPVEISGRTIQGSIRNTGKPPSGSIRNQMPTQIPIKQSDYHVKAGRTIRPDATIKVKTEHKSSHSGGSIRHPTNKHSAASTSEIQSSNSGGFFEGIMNIFKPESDMPNQSESPYQKVHNLQQAPGYATSQFDDLSANMLLDLSSSANMPIVVRLLHAISEFLVVKRIDPKIQTFAGPFLDDVMDRNTRHVFLEILRKNQVDQRLYKMVNSIFTDRVDKLDTPKMQSRLACWLLARILQELVNAIEQQSGVGEAKWLENRVDSKIMRKRINEVLEDNKHNLTGEENQQVNEMQNLVLIDMGKSIRMQKNQKK